MTKKGLASWGFKIFPTEDKNIFDYQGIDQKENKMRAYMIFPGVYVMFIDFKQKYQVENSEYDGNYGYRLCYSYLGNYYTHINETRVLITKDLFIGKSIPKSKESYSTSDKTLAFNISLSPSKMNKKSFYYNIIEKFLETAKDAKDVGYILSNDNIIDLSNQLIDVLKKEDKNLITLKTLELIYEVSQEKISENRKKYYNAENRKDILLIEEFIKDNLEKELDLDLICKIFKISKSNLNNKFIQKFQYTPMKYLNNLRMIKAEEILLSSDKNVIDVAGELGFTNPSNFTRSFKRFTGLSPTKYRKINKY